MDKQILQAIQQKQEQGVTLLLEQYGGLLNAIVRKYIGGRPQEIEECLADIVVAIWYHIDDFDATKNSFKNWIAVIAKFKAIDALRKIERQRPTVELPEATCNNAKHGARLASYPSAIATKGAGNFSQILF